MNIKIYEQNRDEAKLMQMLHEEGEEWSCYWKDEVAPKYRKALHDNITYVAYEEDTLCGSVRALNDCGFYIYICDLLVSKEHRGRDVGRKLMQRLCAEYPKQTVYVMSDHDDYYQHLGYAREGSIFTVSPS